MKIRALLVAALTISATAFSSCEEDTPGDLAPVATVPVVNTAGVSSITQTTAVSGGDIPSDGGAAVVVKGACWSTDDEPTISNEKTLDGEGTGSFISSLTSLTAGTVHYVRAYATNSVGTGYGAAVPFTTLSADPSTVTDVDGNVYRTIRIGSQLWMAENLKATKYNNGDPIPNVTANANWVTLSTPAYCWYQNDYATYGTIYGALYNWYAVDSLSNGSRSVCPAGWHVPTEAEWTTLTSYLGGLSVAGGKMKEAGTAHWAAPNTGATNESGFTALPGGYRAYTGGAFSFVRNFGHWWSCTGADQSLAWGEGLFYLDNPADHSTSVKRNGFSLRCIKD